jgi:agmatinase
MELYDEELQSEPWRAGIETLPPLDISELPPEEMVDVVHKASALVVGEGRIPVLLGGEHSVTLGLFRALKEKHPKLSVLHLDAHADMRAVYDGTPFSHACIARRLAEEGARLVQLGIRSMSQPEALFLGDGGTSDILNVRSYQARQLRAGIDIDEVLAHLSEEVFITIDLDVFDPSIMPSTGTPEPGGLLWEEVTTMLRSIISKKKIVGFDIVELSPVEGNVAPDFMAARLAYRIMGYINKSIDKSQNKE